MWFNNNLFRNIGELAVSVISDGVKISSGNNRKKEKRKTEKKYIMGSENKENGRERKTIKLSSKKIVE